MQNSNSMKANLVPAICTQCGGPAQVNPSQEKAVCEYCDTSFLIEKTIKDYNIKNVKIDHKETLNINNSKRGVVESVFNFIENQKDKKQKQIDEEKRRVEEEKRKQEEQRQKVMTQLFNKKYHKRNLYLLGVLE